MVPFRNSVFVLAEEISRQLVCSHPKAIFCSTKNAAVLREACKLANLADVKLVVVQTQPGEALPANTIDFNEVMETEGLRLSDSAEFNRDSDPNGLCVLPFSSGTTGLPKGVMLSHNNIATNCEATAAKLPAETLVFPTTKSHQDVIPVVLPFYHCYALIVMLVSKLSLGCKMVSMPKYEPNALLRVIREHRATLLHVVPPIVVQLNALDSTKSSDFDSVRNVLSAASALAHKDGERFKEK